MEKISVIIPVYNSEKYLDGCLNSVESQDAEQTEIILVDDGSTDSSGKICLDHAARDGRIRYFRQDNAGVSTARNRGLSEADGDIICFVDSDDRLEKGALSALRRAMEETGADIVIGGYRETGAAEIAPPDAPRLLSGKEEIARYAEEQFRKPFISAVWGKLYRRSVICGGFDPEISMGEDVIFNAGCFDSAGSVFLSDAGVYLYNTQNESSLVSTASEKKYRQAVSSSLRFEKWVKSVLGEGRICPKICEKIASSLYTYAGFAVKDPALGTSPADRIAALSAPETKRAVSVSAGGFTAVQRIWFRLFLSGRYRLCASITLFLNSIRKVLGK